MDSFNQNSLSSFSINSPVAIIFGAASFVGVRLCEKLLEKRIQVIAIDENTKKNRDKLVDCIKSSKFIFVSFDSVNNFYNSLNLKVDYVFCLELFSNKNFVRTFDDLKLDFFVKAKFVFLSSTNFYFENLSANEKDLKRQEVFFAKFIKKNSFNGRILRTAAVFGPGMDFNQHDPIIELFLAHFKIKAVNSQLSDYVSRAVFVEDLVSCLIASVLRGGTNSKIYDIISAHPYRISEIRQLLNSFENNSKFLGFSKLDLWLTPNAKKSINDLSFHGPTNMEENILETVNYFKIHQPDEYAKIDELIDNNEVIPSEIVDKQPTRETRVVNTIVDKVEMPKRKERIKLRVFYRSFGFFIGFFLIVIGIFYPVVNSIYNSINIKNNVNSAAYYLSSGDFEKASKAISNAKYSVEYLKSQFVILGVFEQFDFTKKYVLNSHQMINSISEGLDGLDAAISGSKDLFMATKYITGEGTADPRNLYLDAYLKISDARTKITSLGLLLNDPMTTSILPDFYRNRAKDFSTNILYWSGILSKIQAATVLLPEITALNGQKSYLVVFQNNLELRPTGGFIGSYAKIDFVGGRLKEIKVDDIYNLDGGLNERITPPREFISDLNQKFWYLRDANWEPDFPTSARQIEFFYNKEAGQRVNGVIALNLSSISSFLGAVNGVYLNEYNENVTKANLFEKAISHAEENFFPGSQAKKNYLASLENSLLNKVFFSADANWPEVVNSISNSLSEKQMLLYFSDPILFSYSSSQNWSGVLPRQTEEIKGVFDDLLVENESNMGVNKVNYYLTRSYKLETTVSKEGQIGQVLQINYKNNSPSNAFPGGIYKNRIRFYLPSGTKLSSAVFAGEDITKTFETFSDYGRTGFSSYIEVSPKEDKTLVLNYSLLKTLEFVDGKSSYNLNILKQPGTDMDSFEWKVYLPINIKLGQSGSSKAQEFDLITDLKKDRKLSIDLIKN